MVTIVKSEWHQVEKRYNLEISLDDVIAVYDLHDAEAEEVYNQIVQGEYDIETFIEDAAENDIYFDWDWMDEDDWKMFLNELEKQSGTSIQSLSKDLQVGLKNGHSIEKQFDLVRVVLKNSR